MAGPEVEGRISTTVAASRGSAGCRVPSAYSLACSTRCGGNGIRSTAQISTTSSTSTGASSGSTGTPTADREDRPEQLRGSVGDLRLAGEVGRRGDEGDHRDDPFDLPEVAELGLDR